jgi:hypothetical protein
MSDKTYVCLPEYTLGQCGWRTSQLRITVEMETALQMRKPHLWCLLLKVLRVAM